MARARFPDNHPPRALRSLRFARFLSTGGDERARTVSFPPSDVAAFRTSRVTRQPNSACSALRATTRRRRASRPVSGSRPTARTRGGTSRSSRVGCKAWPPLSHGMRTQNMVVSACHVGHILAIGCVWLSFARSRARWAPSGARAELREWARC